MQFRNSRRIGPFKDRKVSQFISAERRRGFTWKKWQPECPALSNWEVYAIVHCWPFISDSRASAEYEYLVIGSTGELFNRILYAKSRAAALFHVADLLRPDGRRGGRP